MPNGVSSSGFKMKPARTLALASALTSGVIAAAHPSAEAVGNPLGAGTDPPNILFVAFDDVGIDQWANFGWSLNTPAPIASTPVVSAICDAGVRFHNNWTMPNCTPSRACFITGRYPFRTNCTTAITNAMLAYTSLNGAEWTIGSVLKTAGYATGWFGKWHCGEQVYGGATPLYFGFDRFESNANGYVPSIDTTWGGQLAGDSGTGGPIPGRVPCGVLTTLAEGPCCLPDGSCVSGLTGLECAELGGVTPLANDSQGNVVPAADCSGCGSINFSITNAYNTWMMNSGTTPENATSAITHEPMLLAETRHAREWLTDLDATHPEQPWLCVLHFNDAHDPVQTPPPSLAPVDATTDVDCESAQGKKLTFPRMIEAGDKALGNLLVDRGLGAWNADGTFALADLEKANTVIVFTADNGTFYPTVRLPFDPLRAKGTPYQTGVWTPLAIAGPGVAVGGNCQAPVNSVDVFQAICELGGVNPRDVVPASHTLDSKSLAPYLKDPSHAFTTPFNFTYTGNGAIDPNDPALPCLLVGDTICLDQNFTFCAICEDNSGTWAGGGTDCSYRYWGYTCCDVYQQQFDAIANGTQGVTLAIPLPNQQYAMMFDDGDGLFRYKLVTLQYPDCITPACQLEFYRLPRPVPPVLAGLDVDASMIYTNRPDPDPPNSITDPEKVILALLKQRMRTLLESEPPCPGDGNLTKTVDAVDLEGVLASWGETMSWSDFNLDGMVNSEDLAIVLGAWGTNCEGTPGAVPSCLAQ